MAALAGCATEGFSEQVDALAARVDSLENAPPAARDTAGAADDVTALAARVDALENASPATLSGAVNADDVTALAARVGALEGDRPPPAASAGPLVGHVAELSTRVAALEEAAAQRAASPATAAADGHDHRPPTAAAFPHTWTRHGDTLPEEYLAVEFPRGVWRLALESACMGDLSSCPRPGDRVPTVYVRDIAEGPSASISGFRTGSEWCEDFELDRQVHWRLWVGDAAGVTWSLTAARGQCPENR